LIHNLVKWIEISEKNILHNIRESRNYVNNRIKLSTVVKANAYGHDAALIAPILQKTPEVDTFSVVNVEEAEELRKAGITKPIIILGYFTSEECRAIPELDLIPFIYSGDLLQELNSASGKSSKKTRVIVKVDTGMGRLGEKGENLNLLIERVNNCENLEIAGFATHFSQTDEECKEKTNSQIEIFNSFLNKKTSLITEPGMTCAANTGGIFLYPQSHYNMVRLGIGLYGFYPSEYVKKQCSDKLRPVLEYKTKIVHIQRLKKGESVSYGSTWKAQKDAVIAVLPIGYADGYLRAFSNKASVIVNGKKVPVRGRVCMDLTMIDVTDVENVLPETTVTLISADKKSGCTAEDLAKFANTINYEITTMLPGNIPRIVV